MKSAVTDLGRTPAASPTKATDHAALMDGVYRYTRHVYDATRRFYLLGRDTLLKRLSRELRPHDRVLEVGCGTARNLILLAQRRPDLQLFGLDASQQMLDTAQHKVTRAGLERRILLRQGLAEQLDPRRFETLKADRFDAIFFSYSLSMIPPWREAITAAEHCLVVGRRLYVVDFHDQADLPAAFRWALRHWLSLFHVHPDPRVIDELRRRAAQGAEFDVQNVARRYAFVASLRPAPQPTPEMP